MGLFTNLLQAKICSALGGQLIGEDDLGNRYYQETMLLGKPQRPFKRWVIYKSGAVEASNIPAKWFGWLHYTRERALEGDSPDWVKPHQHNMTGSNAAYHPPASLLNSEAADNTSPLPKPYSPWQPTQQKQDH